MIEINLLPRELRKKKKKHFGKMPPLPFLPIAAGLLAVFISLNFVLIFFEIHKKKSLNVLNEKWESMRPEREKTEKLTSEILTLEKRVAATRKIAEPDLKLVKLLEGLSKAVNPNIWIERLDLKSARQSVSGNKGFLEIEGYAIGKNEQATLLVAKFISNLEGIKVFSDFSETIELKNINKRDFSGEEVMRFKLRCDFKEEEGGAVS
ncbi:MAG: PilN domain-containing protein [Candidatus Omnitrophica bacterium]|nr:PilN domain-containing protein [Candidatus Omnitrophota bacterium]